MLGVRCAEARLKVIDNRRDYRVVVHHQGRPAATEYRRLRVFQRGPETEGQQRDGQESEAYSLVEVSPISGRTHQIRAHMLSIGHALVGDAKVRQTEVGPTSAFYSCIPTGMHGPTCICRANLTPCSLSKYNPKRRAQNQAAWCPRLFLHALRLWLAGLEPGRNR